MMKFLIKYYIRKKVIKFESLKILPADKTGFHRLGHNNKDVKSSVCVLVTLITKLCLHGLMWDFHNAIATYVLWHHAQSYKFKNL